VLRGPLAKMDSLEPRDLLVKMVCLVQQDLLGKMGSLEPRGLSDLQALKVPRGSPLKVQLLLHSL